MEAIKRKCLVGKGWVIIKKKTAEMSLAAEVLKQIIVLISLLSLVPLFQFLQESAFSLSICSLLENSTPVEFRIKQDSWASAVELLTVSFDSLVLHTWRKGRMERTDITLILCLKKMLLVFASLLFRGHCVHGHHCRRLLNLHAMKQERDTVVVSQWLLVRSSPFAKTLQSERTLVLNIYLQRQIGENYNQRCRFLLWNTMRSFLIPRKIPCLQS